MHRPHLDALHLRLYRATYFQEEPFRDAYIRHDQFVRNYFRNRPQDLLIFNVCAGESWERLAEFLDKPTPQEPFPRSRG